MHCLTWYAMRGPESSQSLKSGFFLEEDGETVVATSCPFWYFVSTERALFCTLHLTQQQKKEERSVILKAVPPENCMIMVGGVA